MLLLTAEELIKALIRRPRPGEYISTADINKLPHLRRFHARTVRGWLKRGKFKNAVQFAGRWYVPLADAIAFKPPCNGRPALRRLSFLIPFVATFLVETLDLIPDWF